MSGTIPPIPPPFETSFGNPGSLNDSDSDVKEDQWTSNEFMADLNVEYHESALLANQKRFYKRNLFYIFLPYYTSKNLISLSDLTLNMADLTLDTTVPKKTRPSVKVSHAYVVKKKTKKSPIVPKPCFNKKANSSTEQLLLTLMEEVKGLKRKIEILSGTLPASSQPSSSKVTKKKTWFGPCKYFRFKNHLFDDCYSKPKCSTCRSTNHLTKEHFEHATVKNTLTKLKAQAPLKLSPKKALMIPKPLKECKYYGINDHHSDHYEFYLGCEVCGSIAHKPSDYLKKHPNSRRPRIANRSVWYQDSGCSRHITWIKQYLHKYSKDLGPKVVFRDDSSGDTKGYGSVNYNGITLPGLLM
nr:retrovirus-related Pol polyprotein from transposon TNT 1-94 [Tanacetum cinerariifolium]